MTEILNTALSVALYMLGAVVVLVFLHSLIDNIVNGGRDLEDD